MGHLLKGPLNLLKKLKLRRAKARILATRQLQNLNLDSKRDTNPEQLLEQHFHFIREPVKKKASQ